MQGSGTNSNINAGGQRIETRVLAPPGGFSNISFGGESTQADKFGSHNFNPKAQQSAQATSAGGNITSHIQEPERQRPAPAAERHTTTAPPVQQQQQQQKQQQPQQQDHRGRGGSSGGGSSSITFG